MEEGGCLIWSGHLNQDGYAKAWTGKLVHRVLYEAYVGPVPEGHELDHLCRRRNCVNWAHVEPVTHTENVRRGRSAQREQTHCKRGHEFTEANTYCHKNHRICRACRGEAVRRYREKMGAEGKRRHAEAERRRRAARRT